MIKIIIELSSNIIAVSAGLLAFKKMPTAFRIILLVISLALMNELTTTYLDSKKSNDTGPNNIYLILDFGLFLTAGYVFLHKKKLLYILITGVFLFAAGWLYYVMNYVVNDIVNFDVKPYSIWVNNIYLVFDCGLFLTAGYLLLHKKKLLYIFIMGFALFAAAWFYQVMNKGIASFAIQAYIIDSILLIILYGVLLYEAALYGAFWQSPQLWLSFALIIFYGCNIPYFSMIQTVSKLSSENRESLHLFLVVINNLHYLLIALMFIIIYLNKDPLKNEINRR